jgi:hypothetical protein
MAEFRVTYHGSPPFVGALAQMLREEGLDVEDYEAPMEGRSVGVGEAVAIGLVVNGTYDALKIAVKKFREHWPKARVEIEGEEGDGEDAAEEDD